MTTDKPSTIRGSSLDLDQRDSLSGSTHERRGDMLADLHQRLALRRRTRTHKAVATSSVALACVALLVGWAYRSSPQAPVLTVSQTHISVVPVPAPVIVRIADARPGDVLARLAAPTATIRINRLTDHQAVEALDRAGEPGLIVISGRAVLRRDLATDSGIAPRRDDHPEVPGPGAIKGTTESFASHHGPRLTPTAPIG